jgi:hypothetical protein
MNKQNIIVNEGQEYKITANGRIVYQGIAESDTEAHEQLESASMWVHSQWNSAGTLTMRIELV